MLGQARGGSGIERVEEHEVDDSYNETVGMLRDKHVVRRDPRRQTMGRRRTERPEHGGFIDMGGIMKFEQTLIFGRQWYDPGYQGG